jgi:uncharacterized protein (TIGR03118 family)
MFNWLRSTLRSGSRPVVRVRPSVECLEERSLLSANYVQTNLTSDLAGTALNQDPQLQNPWGLAASAQSPFWVSDNSDGLSTLYNSAGQPQPPGTTPPTSPLQVTIPTATAGVAGTPTGIVANSLGGFNVSETVNGTTNTGSSFFIFATQDGQIDGWNPTVDPTHAIVMVDNSKEGASYTGLALGTDSQGNPLLFAANFLQNRIDVFNSSFQPVTTLPATAFQDTSRDAAGYWPFNIQNIGGNLYVEYALPDFGTGEGKAGAGLGFVDVYNTAGVMQNHGHHLIKPGGKLDAPWGVTVAPANFGQFSNDLLVGNFGNGSINAFNPKTGSFIGTLTLATGQIFHVEDLWALEFGNGHAAGPTNTLFFTAGPNNERDGLFGSLQATTPISHSAAILPNLASATVQTFPTTPANGDGNPYGVAFVPQGYTGGGALAAGDLLVSNFNSSSGQQGTGTTIQLITPAGQISTFFQGPSGLGLTTALGVLKSGFVIVGNLPTDAGGKPQQGSLLILDNSGHVVLNLSDNFFLNGPWDLAINDQGTTAQIFVSNVLDGTVTRINLSIPKGGTPLVDSATQIAAGYAHRTDPNALVVGPTGLAYNAATDTLYVASTGDNAIFAIRGAAHSTGGHTTGRMVVQDPVNLHGPLGLVLAPNGDFIVSNGDAQNPGGTANELVEYSAMGKFVGAFQVDPGTAGAAFGIALSTDNGQIRFAAVDDNTNSVTVWTLGMH